MRRQLVKALRGGHAFVPYEKALRGLTLEQVNRRAHPRLHTIYEELEHMRIAQRDLLYYALEDEWESPEWPEGFWPQPGKTASKEDWEQTLRGFHEDQERAVELAQDENIDLLNIIPGSEEYTYLRELMLIVEHNAYHLGKILDSRKAMGAWPPSF